MFDGVRITGLSSLVRACDATEAALATELRGALLDVAEVVADETRSLLGGSDIDFGGKTVSGVTARIGAGGSAWAQQQRRKSSRLSRRRSNFGPLQMQKGFLPAIRSKQTEIEAAADTAVQRVVDRYFHE